MNNHKRHCGHSKVILAMYGLFRRLCLLAMTVLIASSPTMAQDSPPRHPTAELDQKRTEAETRKKELEQKAKSTKSDLENTQKELVSIAAAIKKSEERLNALDARMADNRIEQKDIEKRLKKDKSSIGDLVLALERLNRTPPEAVLAKPGAPLETAQSAMLLQSILPNIYGRAESLKKDLSRLDTILKELAADQAEAKTTMAGLTKRQAEMKSLLEKRKALYAKTRSGIQEQEQALKDIARESANLKDLVAKIEERERTQAAIARTASAAVDTGEPARAASVRPTPIPRPGSAQLPVSGAILTSYGQTDDIGAESQGLTLQGRSGALVVSPMGGVVRYAGIFKNYGQIIIVEHQKEYHSLIAGLARIDTVVGQSVAAGEPVGILGKNSGDGGGPTLYYELRYRGQPINPSRKFAGL